MEQPNDLLIELATELVVALDDDMPLIRTRIVDAYAPTVRVIAGRFSNQQNFDDHQAAGFLGLMQGIQAFRVAEIPPAYFPRYIYKYVRGRVMDAAKATWYPKGVKAHPICGIPCDQLPYTEPDSSVDVEDLIRLLASDEQDHKIITMRMEGYTLNEIGAEVGLSQQVVGRRLVSFMQRYQKQEACNGYSRIPNVGESPDSPHVDRGPLR